LEQGFYGTILEFVSDIRELVRKAETQLSEARDPGDAKEGCGGRATAALVDIEDELNALECKW
jgi:hypothetical protein